MTDDELQARLRRLDGKPDADWDAMAAAVRDGYARAGSEARARVRRRRAAASIGGALALAAALALYVRAQHHVAAPPTEDELGLFDDADPDELIDELTPAQLDRVSLALKKGA